MSLEPRLRTASLVLAALALPCTPAIAIAGGVRIVSASGQSDFPDVQPAVDAALDGDVLLVGAGSYPGFTVDGKNLSIFAVPAGAQGVTVGSVTIRNLPGGSVVLCGFDAAKLIVDGCAGYVGIQGCTFTDTDFVAGDVGGSTAVVLAGCTLTGADAPTCSSCSHGQPGGDGLRVGSSVLAAYGCTLRGGRGADCCTDTARGGVGGAIDGGSWAFASGCSFAGGASGDGTIGCMGGLGTWCGAGGDGLQVAGEFHALSNDYAGGPEGANCCSTGASGASYSCGAGTCDFLPGVARRFELPWLSVDRAPWSLTVEGAPADQLFLNRSLAPTFQYEPALSGVCTSVLPPFAPAAPIGILPASGSATVSVRQRLLPDDVLARVHFLQGYALEPGGATVLGSPMHVLSLNWNSLPDCNANGVQDYAEVIVGLTPDVDHDLVPDGCP